MQVLKRWIYQLSHSNIQIFVKFHISIEEMDKSRDEATLCLGLGSRCFFLIITYLFFFLNTLN